MRKYIGLVFLIIATLGFINTPRVLSQTTKKTQAPSREPLIKNSVAELYDRVQKTLKEATVAIEARRTRMRTELIGKTLETKLVPSFDWKVEGPGKQVTAADVANDLIYSKELEARKAMVASMYEDWKQKKVPDKTILRALYSAAADACVDAYICELPSLEIAVIQGEGNYAFMKAQSDIMDGIQGQDRVAANAAYWAGINALNRKTFQDLLTKIHHLHDQLDQGRKRWGPILWQYIDFAEARTASASDGHAEARAFLRSRLEDVFSSPDIKTARGLSAPSREGYRAFNVVRGLTVGPQRATVSPALRMLIEGTKKPNGEEIWDWGTADWAKKVTDPDIQPPDSPTTFVAGYGLKPSVEGLRGYKEQPSAWAIWTTRIVPDATAIDRVVNAGLGIESKTKPNTYTLFIYGPKLPVKRSEFQFITAFGAGDNSKIKYTPISFLDQWNSLKAAARSVEENELLWKWNKGWQLATTGLNRVDTDNVLNGASAILVQAEVAPGVVPGPKTFLFNGVQGTWFLDRGTTEAKIRFVRELPDDEATPGVKQFEPVNHLYVPGRFHIEVETTLATTLDKVPVDLTRDAVPVFSDSPEPLYATPVEGNRTLFRSPPLQIVEVSDPRLEPSASKLRDMGTLYLYAAPNQGFVAEPSDPKMFRMTAGMAATAPTQASSEALWMDALKTAAQFDGQQPGDWAKISRQKADAISHVSFTNISFRVLEMAEMITDPTGHKRHSRRVLSALLFDEPDLGKGKLISTAEIKVGDHAAMILLRRQFIKSMEAYQKQLPQLNGPDMVAGFRKLIEPQMRDESSALARIMVPVPLKLNSGTGGTFDINQPVEVPLACAFNKTFLNDRFSVLEKDRQEHWINASVKIGLERFKKAITAALDKAKKTKEGDIKALMELTGNGFRPIVAELLPDLVRPVTDATGATVAWVPDKDARSWLKSVTDTIENVRAQAEESEIDTNVAMTAASLIPIALPESLAKTLLSLALNVGFAVQGGIELAHHDVDMNVESDFALGAAAVIGTERYDMAQLQKTSIWPVVLNFALCGLGVTAETASAMSSLSKLQAVQRTGVVLEQMSTSGAAAVLKMVPRDQAAFFDAAAEAEIVERLQGTERLTRRQSEIIKRYKELVETTKKQRVLEKTVILPEFDTTIPKTSVAGNPDFPRMEATYGDPPPLGKNEYAAIWKNRPVPNNYIWTAPDGTRYRLGDRIAITIDKAGVISADSANCHVIKLEGENALIKFVPYRESGLPAREVVNAGAKTAKFGRQAKQIVEDTQLASKILEEEGILQAKILKYAPDGDPPYFVQTFLKEEPGKLLFASNKDTTISGVKGSLLKPEFQHATLKLFKKMAKSKLVWEDCHFGNLYFEKINGEWVAGILDQDRICRWGQWTENVENYIAMLEFAPNKVEVYSMSSGISDIENGHAFRNPEPLWEKLLEYKKWIGFEKTGYVDKKLSLELVEQYFPNLRKNAGLSPAQMHVSPTPPPSEAFMLETSKVTLDLKNWINEIGQWFQPQSGRALTLGF